VIDQWEALARPDAFIRFYVGLSTTRSSFFDRIPEGLQVVTTYGIAIYTTKDVPNPKIKIFQQGFGTARPGAVLNFSFYIRLDQFDKVKWPLKSVLFWYAVVAIAAVAVRFIWFGRRRAHLKVPYREIWRITPQFIPTLLVSAFGFSIAIAGVIMLFVTKRKTPVGAVVWISGIVGSIPAVLCLSFVIGALQLELTEGTLRVPGIVYYLVVLFPQRLFAMMFRSLRGYPFFHCLVYDSLFVATIVLVSKTVKKFHRRHRNPVEVSFGDPLVKLRPLTCGHIFWEIVYILITAWIVTSATRPMVSVLYDDRAVPYRVFRLVGFFYAGLAALGGVLRTKSRTLKRRRHWTRDHLLIHFPIALAFALSLVFDTLHEFEKLEFQVFVGMLAILIPAFFAIWAYGTFFSFAAAFITVFFAFSQEKVS
jgi:hypothetical protein